MKHRYLKSIGIVLSLCLTLLSGCTGPTTAEQDENVILCTTFAAYDWVREILGDTDTFTCRMLVDNGVDLHSYQPSAQDIMKIADCRMLVYVGGESDTWVSDALAESGNEDIVAISLLDLVGDRALNEVELEGVEGHHHHDHDNEDHDHDEHGHEAEITDYDEHGHEAETTDYDEYGHEAEITDHDDHYDEHVWLSLKNAIVCTETLADAVTKLDSCNSKKYAANAKDYTGKLEALDADYQTMRDTATQTTILIGDRFPFLYLAEDYDIHYFAAYSGCSADAEASVHTVTYLAEKLQEYKLPAIYVVDNGTDSLARTIAESADMTPEILHLSSMQSVTKEDIQKGCTYLSYMEENLQMLKEGLQAP
ncbi:MAG: metal ABC transporter substrate-binding protein [Clostridium sp.]|nr:metal ABC transporter substrate-binding protein [Clostridium sp.]